MGTPTREPAEQVGLTPAAIAVHGGAGAVPDRALEHLEAEARVGLRRALDAGGAILDAGGSSLEAVEVAVSDLEDAEVFNAGHGSVLTADATIELEAAIMDGESRRAGAVIGVSHVRNPVRLARLVMERSGHVALAGHAAELFGAQEGLDLVRTRELLTERRLRSLFGDAGESSTFGTVGAVAVDAHGCLAVATSTGGVTGKSSGRVGDTPVIGGGTYADTQVAVSCTGDGDYFVRAVAAHSVAQLVAQDVPLAEAAARVLDDVAALGGSGGLIALDRLGRLVMPFTSAGMHRGYRTTDGRVTIAVSDEPLA